MGKSDKLTNVSVDELSTKFNEAFTKLQKEILKCKESIAECYSMYKINCKNCQYEKECEPVVNLKKFAEVLDAARR